MIANKKAISINIICIFQFSVDGVIKIFHHIIFDEITTNNGKALNTFHHKLFNQIGQA